MSSLTRERHILPLIGYFAWLVGAIILLWFATAVIIPKADVFLRPYHEALPQYLQPAFRINPAIFDAIRFIAFAGIVLLIVALVGKGPALLVSGFREALGFLALAVSVLVAYMLLSGSVGPVIAAQDQTHEIHAYKLALDHFGLLEETQGRFDKIFEEFRKSQGAKIVEVPSVSDLDDADIRARIPALLSILAEETDPAAKKRLLATLYLFRGLLRPDETRDVPRYAVEAGAPTTNSPADTFQWIAANLNKDGWDPLPLFKISE